VVANPVWKDEHRKRIAFSSLFLHFNFGQSLTIDIGD